MTHALRATIAIAAFLCAGANACLDSSNLERIDRLLERMIDRELLTDREVVDMVFKGIHNPDREVVEQTIGAVFWLAFAEAGHNVAPEFASRPRQIGRPLDEVPGLRDFLVRIVQAGLEDEGLSKLHDFATEVDSLPLWGCAPLPLAAYFPSDPLVEDVLLGHGLATPVTGLLNVGRFTSEAADAQHRRQLADPPAVDPAVPGSDAQADIIVAAAARGLALSKTDAGLAALVEALDRGVAVAVVAEAIAAHGRRAVPHKARLWDLLLEDDQGEPAKAPCSLAGHPACLSPRLRIERAVTRLETLAERYPAPGDASPAATPAPPVSNSVIGLYERLADQQADVDSLPDGNLADLVFEGVHSRDLRIVEWTVRALARDALATHLPAVVPGAPRRATRPLHDVPGLRDFLMEQSAKGLADVGFGAFAAARPDLDRLPMPAQALLPLAVYFAGDLAVHDFLLGRWRERRDVAVGDQLRGVVRLLDAGGFKTAAADRLRMALLAQGDAEAVAWAAGGLAKSQTDAGLAALVSALGRGVALGAVAEAIVLHGERALPHLGRLGALDAAPAERARIAGAVARLARLAP